MAEGVGCKPTLCKSLKINRRNFRKVYQVSRSGVSPFRLLWGLAAGREAVNGALGVAVCA